ncbi:aldehyde dehydrogenase family protein [Patescibacteria group bacterium]|nr:aldehyde dehydrogenase family protein [Patescibacteria group bacterium]
MIIDGKLTHSDKRFDIINPYTKEKVGSAPIASSQQIKKALEFSYQSKPKLTSKERVIVLKNIANKLRENKKELSELITHESGLCLKDTLHEVDRAIDVALFSSIVAENIENDITSEYILSSQKDKPKLKVITEPLDLVVGITPFNHPLNQVVHKVFPAIAAGTCMVLKPSEKTPLTAIKLGGLLLEAGLEKNMLNIITGIPAEDIVDMMVSSVLVDKVTFTGGLDAGLSILNKMVDSGNGLKKYIPELGGCSSLIIHNDANIPNAVEVAIAGCFKNSGQRCTAIRRVIVIESIADEFVDMITQKTKEIKYGNPYDIEMDMGTVITEDAAKIIEKRVNDAICDGADLKIGNFRNGALYSPTVLDKVKITSDLVSKETFGPVCSVIRTKDIDGAIKLANLTNYRLAGAVMTKSRGIAEKVSNSLIVGQFNWNGIPGYRTEAAPFGGFKDSGNGEKEGVILMARSMRRMRTFYEHRM